MLTAAQPRSLRDRLQRAAFALMVLVATLAATMHFGGEETSPFRHLFGDDLVPSYMAGTFVRQGRADLLTDYAAAERFQRDLRVVAGLEQHGRTGPWLNPPFYAAVFVPLSSLPYRAAVWTWFGLNVVMLSASVALLYRMLPADRRRPADAAVLAALLVCSMPALQVIACQQNTFLSLLILCGAVTLARADRPFAAGAIGALLLFKPQLAVIVCGALACTLGLRAIAGMAVTTLVLLTATAVCLPGALGDYLHKLPALLPYLRTDRPYPWERQVTFLGFWRLLLDGRAGGPNPPAVTILWLVGAAGVAVTLIGPLWKAFVANNLGARFNTNARRPRSDGRRGDARSPSRAAAVSSPALPLCVVRVLRVLRGFVLNRDTRTSPFTRDRLLGATIAAAPLLMPYYMDYDLLLLAVPAVLLAAERMQTGRQAGDRWLILAWAALYGWAYISAAFADATGVSVLVLLMLVRFVIPIRTIWATREIAVPSAATSTAVTPVFERTREDPDSGDVVVKPAEGASPNHPGLREYAQTPACTTRPQRLRSRAAGLMLPVGIALVVLSIAAGAGLFDRTSPLTFGHDFVPAYVGGRLTLEGRSAELYDVEATRAVGRAVIADQNLTKDPSHVLWINPPAFALLFAPLAALPYRVALGVWLGLNAAIATAAIRTLLKSPTAPPRAAYQHATHPTRVSRPALLLILFLLCSCPFLLAVEHQQNTFLSLGLLTAAVVAWCRNRPIFAGLLVGLLAYKPQLAVAVGVVLCVVEGRRAVAGLVIGGLAVLIAGEAMASGSTFDFLTRVPASAAVFQQHPGYNWGRQMTPTAFLRTLMGPGSPSATAAGLAVSITILALVLFTAWRVTRNEPSGVRGALGTRTPIIALSFTAMPLVVPYFMDYDLLLLVIPAALLLSIGQRRAVAFAGLALWLMAYLNVDLTAATDVNGMVLVLTTLVLLQCRWLLRRAHVLPVAVDNLAPAQPLPFQPACP